MAEDTPTAREEGQTRGPAILLALAAIVGVALGGRAALVSSNATDAWQGALRQEIKRAAATVEQVRYVYGSEAPVAFQVAEASMRARAARQVARGAQGLTREALLVQARTLELFADKLGEGIQEGLTEGKYRTPKGGFDAAKRLADERRRSSDLVAIDPERAHERGDRLSRQSILEAMATIPPALAFLLGALAEAFPRPRRLLVLGGALLLVAAAVMGIVVEAVYP